MKKFKDFGLDARLLKGLEALGFVQPTDIQDEAIPFILESNQDLIALAQTGTGKTAAFGLPILEQIDTKSELIQAIILCPTRELCLQIANDLQNYAKYQEEVKILAVYGGTDIRRQLKALKEFPQIIVGTPGRTLDLIHRKQLNIDEVNFVVLDEADEMLNMGFRQDIDAILEDTPKGKQTLLFSATMPSEMKGIVKRYMTKPHQIAIGRTNEAVENVSHSYYMAKASDRYEVLKRIVDLNCDMYGIIFCRTRRETKDIARHLSRDGYNAEAIHGDLSQSQRDEVMDKFRNRQTQLLVATDVAARGIDINELTHVININIPDDLEVYVHRSGRTGRAGNKGESIIITHSKQNRELKALQKFINRTIERKEIPSGEEVVKRRLLASIERLKQVEVKEEQIAPFLPSIHEQLADLDREAILKHYAALEFNLLQDYYKEAKDLNKGSSKREHEEDGESKRGRMTRFFLALGKGNKLKPANLLGLINELTDNPKIEVGHIEILKNFSFFEAEKKYEELLLASFDKGGYELQVVTEKQKKKEDGYFQQSFKKRNPKKAFPSNREEKRNGYKTTYTKRNKVKGKGRKNP